MPPLGSRGQNTFKSTSSAKNCIGVDILEKPSSAKKLAKMKVLSEKACSKRSSIKGSKIQDLNSGSEDMLNGLRNARKSARSKNISKHDKLANASESKEKADPPASNIRRSKKNSSTKEVTSKRGSIEPDVMSSLKKKLLIQSESNCVSKMSIAKRASSARTKKSDAVSHAKKKKAEEKVSHVKKKQSRSIKDNGDSESASVMSDSDKDIDWVPVYNEHADSSESDVEKKPPTLNIKPSRKIALTKKLIPKRKSTELDVNGNINSPKKKLRSENSCAPKKPVKKATSADTKKPGAVSRAKKRKSNTEKRESNSEQPSTSAKISAESADVMSESDSDVDWEEVEELPTTSPRKEPVQITLETKKKKAKGDWKLPYAKMLWNRYQRLKHESVHKIQLMCLLTHGKLVNEVCNSPLLRALIMSTYSSARLKGSKCTMKSVQSLVNDLVKCFNLDKRKYLAPQTNLNSLEEDLSLAFQTCEVRCETHLVLLVIAILRFVGATVRLCMAWNPILFKIAQYQKEQRLCKLVSEKGPSKATTKGKNKLKSSDSSSDGDELSMKSSKPIKKRKVAVFNFGEGIIFCADYQYYWLEVYVEKKWVPIECASVKIDDVQAITDRLPRPLTYIMSYDNSNKVKDVSARYNLDWWMLSTKKQRVEQNWWEDLLKPYHVKESKRTRDEDQEFINKFENMPFPKTIGGFKDHPLYALERHFLKFEAIYPPTAVPLGYTGKNNEPVYARSCVKTLHTRETWLKDAKQVKMGEKPYKFVKPRPKIGEKGTKITEATQGVFGLWQTEPYEPPVAENGKVPRNAYGNVDLFKPEMMPIGCAHVQIDGIGKLARKLNIDCTQAMVGWELLHGYNCPIFDGWIVCKEYEQTLLNEWKEFEAEEKRKEQEKREKIIYGRWKTLIKGLLIRERLRNRYGTENF